jgi:CRP-like cAMP-binding protein
MIQPFPKAGMHDSPSPQAQIANRLLAALPPDEFAFLQPHLELVAFPNGHFVALAGDALKRCYFPNTGMISLLAETHNGAAIEVGFTGVEGMVGVPILLGKNSMPFQALVQSPSEGYVAETGRVLQLFSMHGVFHDAALRYAYVIMRQITQSAVCNHFHTIEARLCRWLTVMCERSGRSDLRLTHEFLAHMLGVQRTSVGSIALELQRAGVINYRRGHIEIINFVQLKKNACECYRVMETEYAELMRPLKQKAQAVSSARQTAAMRLRQTDPEHFRKKR